MRNSTTSLRRKSTTLNASVAGTMFNVEPSFAIPEACTMSATISLALAVYGAAANDKSSNPYSSSSAICGA
eukprot:29952-Pelagococcus_subviridis.AAC.17